MTTLTNAGMAHAQRLAQNIAAQRDRAMNESAMLATHLEIERSQREAAFQVLWDCIQSGQVPQEDAPRLAAQVPGLQDWIDDRERARMKEEERKAQADKSRAPAPAVSEPAPEQT